MNRWTCGASERASEPRERSAPTKRRARERVGESEGRKPLGKADGGNMKRIAVMIVLAGMVAWSGAAVRSQSTPPAGGSDRPPVAKAQYDQWKTELSNWGRWGKEDEIGALNLITPAKRQQAAALVKDGITVSLAGDVNTAKAEDNSRRTST